MKRILMASVVAVTVAAAVAVGTAWATPGAPSSAVITFDDSAQQVPPCDSQSRLPATQPNCQWRFSPDEPILGRCRHHLRNVGNADPGLSSELLRVVTQADAYVGPPWVPKRGWQHTIEDCTTAATATTDLPDTGGTTATTDQPDTPPSSTPTDPGTGAGWHQRLATPSGPPPGTRSSYPDEAAAAAPTVSPATGAPAPTPSALPETAAASARPTSLPFTGADLQPFVYLGTMFVVLGLVLMARRRQRPL